MHQIKIVEESSLLRRLQIPSLWDLLGVVMVANSRWIFATTHTSRRIGTTNSVNGSAHIPSSRISISLFALLLFPLFLSTSVSLSLSLTNRS
jgi:hypothetical protein